MTITEKAGQAGMPIDRKNNMELVQRINRRCPDITDEDEAILVEKSKRKYKDVIKEEWQQIKMKEKSANYPKTGLRK